MKDWRKIAIPEILFSHPPTIHQFFVHRAYTYNFQKLVVFDPTYWGTQVTRYLGSVTTFPSLAHSLLEGPSELSDRLVQYEMILLDT